VFSRKPIASLCSWTTIGALALTSGPSLAQEQQAAQEEVQHALEVRVVTGQSDNVNRDAADPLRASYDAAGLAFDISSDRQRFAGLLGGDVEQRRYSTPVVSADGDEDETVGSVDGSAQFRIVPERFDWNLALSSGQIRSDPLAAATPDNRERITIFTMGPAIQVPVAERTMLGFAASVADRRFEDTPGFDNDAVDATIEVLRTINTRSTASLEFNSSEVDYDGVVDYDFKSVFLTYRTEFASGGMNARLGSGKVSSSGFDSGSTPLYAVRWERAVATRSRMAVWAARELTDPGEQFAGGTVPALVETMRDFSSEPVAIDDIRLQEVVLADSPLDRESVGVSFAVTRPRSQFQVAVGSAEEEFITSPESSNDTRFGEITYGRDIGRRWRGDLWLRDLRQQFNAGESDEQIVGASARRLFSERAALVAGFSRTSRDSEPEPSDENLYFVGFSYQLIRR
jgi:hypothetical protein